jgi:predicted ester cyclase
MLETAQRNELFPAGARPTMLEENKRLIRQGFEEIWNQGDFSESHYRYAPDYLLHMPDGTTLSGPQGHDRIVTGLRGAFPDLTVIIQDQVAEGDKVVSLLIAKGTHRGEFMGIKPTGRIVSVMGITIDRVADGMLFESWACWDLWNLLQQLGVVN